MHGPFLLLSEILSFTKDEIPEMEILGQIKVPALTQRSRIS